MKEYLPIGSIVLLNNGNKRIMIYGRRQRDIATNKEYDYIACLYPEGNLNEQYMYLFNHEDIKDVIFRGYVDIEEENFKKEFLNGRVV